MIKYDENLKVFSDGDKDNDLYILFSRARYLTFRAREKELQRYRMTPEKAQVLFIIQALGKDAIPARVSKCLLRQPHSVSSIVERMQKDGLVKKVKDLDRKNLVRIELTESGQKAYDLTIKRGPIHRMMGALKPEEQQQFREYLEKIMAVAEKELGLNQDNLPVSEYSTAGSE